MKEEKRYKKHSYAKIINTYLLVCIVGLIISIPLFNNLVNKQDLEMSEYICTLIAEKMNNSITYMTESVSGRAEVLSGNRIDDWNILYENLVRTMNVEGCNSIGLIDKNDHLYGRKNEDSEFEKWGLKEQARNTEKVFFSAPYRHGVSGKMVVTIFAPIYQDGERAGELFMTYDLEKIQNMAQSNVVIEDMEIYLMNPYSHNYIRCYGVDKAQIGSWNNTKLLYDQIKIVKGMTYPEWEEAMRNGQNGEAVFFKLNKKTYTQVFVNIDVMEDWSVVVTIPSEALTHNLRVFHVALIVACVLLIFSLLIMYILSNKNVEAERRMLEYLSTHDSLTRLGNRRAFEKTYSNYLTERKELNLTGALIFFDIDYFKQVNDGFGHAMGDKVLQEFASITQEVFSDIGTVFRFGGDEFVLLIPKVETREIVESLLNELRERLRHLDFLVDKNGKVFVIHYSAGIVELSGEIGAFETIDRNADKAMYQVKQKGRDGFAWYTE